MDKRELILSEAEKLFAEKGYYGLGLSELLKRCGIPKGSFYYYFPEGKIQLIQEVLEYSYRRMCTWIDSWKGEKATAAEAFAYMADHLSNGIREKRRLGTLMLSMIAIESVYLDEQVNCTCKRIYSSWQAYYARWLEDYGYDPQQSLCLAQAVFALIHGSLISSWIKQDPRDLQLAKEALSMMLAPRE
ncbi:MAG: TetR/AcrR family transcriptional regulator [Clostridia bacterium]|nr:TetR/AcrR family transcriptional regulator [Clostridia bacterium]